MQICHIIIRGPILVSVVCSLFNRGSEKSVTRSYELACSGLGANQIAQLIISNPGCQLETVDAHPSSSLGSYQLGNS